MQHKMVFIFCRKNFPVYSDVVFVRIIVAMSVDYSAEDGPVKTRIQQDTIVFGDSCGQVLLEKYAYSNGLMMSGLSPSVHQRDVCKTLADDMFWRMEITFVTDSNVKVESVISRCFCC